MSPKSISVSESVPDIRFNPSTVSTELEINWRKVIYWGSLHIGAIYGLYLLLTFSAKWQSVLFAYFLYIFNTLGTTAGAHRLWSHRSYKAKWPLRVFLAIAQTMAFQNTILEWCRDHRVHHKFSETDADPHNAKCGFFYSHIGWLLCKKHPDVQKQKLLVDLTDVLADPIVMFQKRHYMLYVLLICFVIPTYIPVWLWNESVWNSFFVCTIFRFAWSINMTWLVNSAAHMWGNRPYDVNINPRESIGVSIGVIGEGYHNYHHVFPVDYRTSEFSTLINLTSIFIEICAKLGLAYDLKTVTPDVIAKRKERTGEKN